MQCASGWAGVPVAVHGRARVGRSVADAAVLLCRPGRRVAREWLSRRRA